MKRRDKILKNLKKFAIKQVERICVRYFNVFVKPQKHTVEGQVKVEEKRLSVTVEIDKIKYGSVVYKICVRLRGPAIDITAVINICLYLPIFFSNDAIFISVLKR